MKALLFSDSHIGVKRFSEEARRQFLAALEVGKREKVDVAIHAGDLFDSWRPSLDDIRFVMEAFLSFKEETGAEVVVIAGNHDITARDTTRAVDILHSSKAAISLRGQMVEVGDIKIIGMPYTLNEKAYEVAKLLTDKHGKADVFLMHQDIRELSFVKESPSIGQLKGLGHSLVVNGHIHKQYITDGLVIPGSTVATKINEDEIEPRAVLLWDGESIRRMEIPSRKIIIETIRVDGMGKAEIEEAIAKAVERYRRAYERPFIKIKLTGTLKAGLTKGDIAVPKAEDVVVDKSQLTTNLAEKAVLWHAAVKEKSISEKADEAVLKAVRGRLKILKEEDYLALIEGRFEKVVEKRLKEEL